MRKLSILLAFVILCGTYIFPMANAVGTPTDDIYGVARKSVVGLVSDTNLTFMDVTGISFQEYIGINIMFANSKADKYDTFYVVAIQNNPEKGAIVSICDAVPYSAAYTIFVHRIMAWSMTEQVTLTLCAEKNGVIYVGQTIETSVEAMALTGLKTYAAAGDATLCNVLVDLLNYGAAVQINQGYNVGSLPDAGEYAKYGTTDVPTINAQNVVEGIGTKVYQIGLSMQAQVEIQMMFKTADMADKTFKASVNGEDTAVEYTPYRNYTICRVAIGATQMRDTFTLGLYNKDGTAASAIYNVSVEGYAVGLLKGENCDVIIAMMRYGDAVKAIDRIDGAEYIEISSADDIYALARILSRDCTKTSFYGADYSIDNDLNRFAYPDSIAGHAAKIEYLATAAYKLTSDISLTMQRANDTTFFTGLGSVSYPFKGTFDGNGKTITLKSAGTIAFNANMSPTFGFIGRAVRAKIINTNIKIEQDILVNRCAQTISIGALVGKAQDCEISNCTVAISNSKFGAEYAEGEQYVSRVWVGGLVGESATSIIRDCNVIMNDSTIQAKGYDIITGAMYANFSVGGLLGFSQPGSNNSDNIGQIGNQMISCNLISNNTTQRDVLISSLRNGDEVVVGGLIGCTFNNFVAKYCTVNITNGNIVAEKTGETDRDSVYGTTVGGFIGRLEHTGELYDCSVTGNFLNIISKSPENKSTAGGIVGTDIGPYHREVISLNKCSFNGNGTSTIAIDVTADGAVDKWNALGGIVGYGNYIIKDCAAKGITLINQSTGVDKCYVGGICGLYNNYGFWATKTYFIPQPHEIRGCSASDIVLDTTENVKIGEIFAFAQ